MSTYFATPGTSQSRWHVIDANGQVVGRVATATARLLQGKHKATYTPFLDTGDHVVVVNAAKVKLTGRKLDDKVYRWHSNHPGGLKEVPAGTMLARRPEKLVEEAIWGMLPKGPLGRQMVRKLKVYRGSSHPHEAQQPKALAIASARRADR
jgi:large subunit ribosomal protein L13